MAELTTGKQRFPQCRAWPIALGLQTLLAPVCECVRVAGSLRRGLPDVGDIELVCIPREGEGLDRALQELMQLRVLEKRRDKRGRETYGPKNKLLLHVPSGIPVDIFTASRENWGMALLVRTGPAEFNIRVMATLLRKGMRGHAYGGVTVPGRGEVPCPDEETVFRLLGWDYIPPEHRDVKSRGVSHARQS